MYKNYISLITSFFAEKKDKKDFFDDVSKENDLLCRFVLDGLGIKIGESIALSNDIIIIKTKKNFLGVPLKHVSEKENNLIVKGLLDKEKAIEIGEEWRKTTLDKNQENEDK